MLALSVVLIFGYGVLGTFAEHGHGSILCHQCHGVSDPSHCTQVVKCWREAVCMTEVRNEHGQNLFWKGCVDKHKCADHNANIVGKRQHHGAILCYECCDSTGCNTNQQCQAYNTLLKTTTTPRPTTTATAAPIMTTMVALPACMDHEEDGVTCASIAHDGFCTSDLSYVVDIKMQKCPKYCGLCDDYGNFITTTGTPPKTATVFTTGAPIVTDMPVDASTTGAMPCVDDESGGFNCASFDTLNFCTDTTSVAYPLAIEKCPAHCGFCTPTGN